MTDLVAVDPSLAPSTDSVPMLDLFTEFATDPVATEQGTWVPYKGGIEFLIARAGNKRFNRMLRNEMDKHPELMIEDADLKKMTDAQRDAVDAATQTVMIGVEASTVLLGWRGPFQFRGQPLTYSTQTAEILLRMPDFRNWVMGKAREQAVFRAKLDEADAKN